MGPNTADVTETQDMHRQNLSVRLGWKLSFRSQTPQKHCVSMVRVIFLTQVLREGLFVILSQRRCVQRTCLPLLGVLGFDQLFRRPLHLACWRIVTINEKMSAQANQLERALSALEAPLSRSARPREETTDRITVRECTPRSRLKEADKF